MLQSKSLLGVGLGSLVGEGSVDDIHPARSYIHIELIYILYYYSNRIPIPFYYGAM